MYKHFYGYLKAVIKRYSTDEMSVEELINDTYIKIFDKIDTFKGSGELTVTENHFKAWIAKIGSRTAIDHLRKKKINFSDIDNDVVINNYVANHQNSSSSEYKEIIKLLNKLPEKHRLVFNLYEIEGFSHDEIAKMLHVTESICRVYLSRAKAKLRELYLKQV